MKIKHLVYIMLLGAVTNDRDVIALFIFQHGFRLNTEAYIKCRMVVVVGGGRAALHGKGLLTADPTTGFCATLHKQDNPVLAVRIHLRPHHHENQAA